MPPEAERPDRRAGRNRRLRRRRNLAARRDRGKPSRSRAPGRGEMRDPARPVRRPVVTGREAAREAQLRRKVSLGRPRKPTGPSWGWSAAPGMRRHWLSTRRLDRRPRAAEGSRKAEGQSHLGAVDHGTAGARQRLWRRRRRTRLVSRICGTRPSGADRTAMWLARVSQTLRERGHFVSTASAIEAAAARTRAGRAARPARSRLRRNCARRRIACLCHGEACAVGDVVEPDCWSAPASARSRRTRPLAPLLEDLAARAEGGAAEARGAGTRDSTLDLRSESGPAALDPAAPAARCSTCRGGELD